MIVELFAAPLIMTAISVFYYTSDKNPLGGRNRFLSAAHGWVATLLFCGAVLVGATGHASAGFAVPFLCLQLLPLGLIGFSLVVYQGPPAVHLLQLPNIACILWAWFIGTMAITNDWL